MERYDLPSNPVASSEQAGVLRIASEVDEKNCGCVDAAITPSNLYSLLDCRKANTAYAAGVIVTCPYHKEFLLKCTTGGTTSANSLDTTAVTKGSVITDGGAKWTVIASQIIDMDISEKAITVTFIDGTQKTLTTQDTAVDTSLLGSAFKLPYATCSTAATTTAKVATITNGVAFTLEVGATVVVKFSNGLSGQWGNGSKDSLNVNSTGAKPTKAYTTQVSGAASVPNNTYMFIYDGTYWNMLTFYNYQNYDE